MSGPVCMADRGIAQGMTRRPARFFFADGPARFCLVQVRPFWELSGVSRQNQEVLASGFVRTFRLNIFSIGSAALFVLVYLLLLILLY